MKGRDALPRIRYLKLHSLGIRKVRMKGHWSGGWVVHTKIMDQLKLTNKYN